MLFDPRWQVSEPSNLDFAAWLETKNPDEKYIWVNYSGQCAIDQYLNARGFKEYWKDGGAAQWRLDAEDLAMRENTFGGLLKRVRRTLNAKQ